TGSRISRWTAVSPGSYVVPHTRESGMKPLAESVMKGEYRHSLAYLRHFEETLSSRPIHRRWGRANPFYALYVIGPYTFSDWKVVWKRTTRDFEAAVVGTLPVCDDHRAVVIPNGKVMMMSFDTVEAADYVCGVLNSSQARNRINAGIS